MFYEMGNVFKCWWGELHLIEISLLPVQNYLLDAFKHYVFLIFAFRQKIFKKFESIVYHIEPALMLISNDSMSSYLDYCNLTIFDFSKSKAHKFQKFHIHWHQLFIKRQIECTSPSLQVYSLLIGFIFKIWLFSQSTSWFTDFFNLTL